MKTFVWSLDYNLTAWAGESKQYAVDIVSWFGPVSIWFEIILSYVVHDHSFGRCSLLVWMVSGKNKREILGWFHIHTQEDVWAEIYVMRTLLQDLNTLLCLFSVCDVKRLTTHEYCICIDKLQLTTYFWTVLQKVDERRFKEVMSRWVKCLVGVAHYYIYCSNFRCFLLFGSSLGCVYIHGSEEIWAVSEIVFILQSFESWL